MDDNISKGCMIPLAQAVITALFVGAVVVAVGKAAGWTQTLYIALAVAGCTALWWWGGSIRSWRRYTFEEPFEPLPIPALAAEPEPPAAEARTFRIELVSDQGRRIQLADLPEGVTPDQVQKLGQGILEGASFSESYWTGRGRPFSRSQFRALRDVFLRRGWLAWRDEASPAQGLELTHAGKAIIRHFAYAKESDPPPHQLSTNPDTW